MKATADDKQVSVRCQGGSWTMMKLTKYNVGVMQLNWVKGGVD